jgi:hypothetical protein
MVRQQVTSQQAGSGQAAGRLARKAGKAGTAGKAGGRKMERDSKREICRKRDGKSEICRKRD